MPILIKGEPNAKIYCAAELRREKNEWNIVSSISIGGSLSLAYALINKEADDEIIFGKINDSEITKLQLRTEAGEVMEPTFLEAQNTIWYLQWKYTNAELIGYAADGEIIYQSTLRK